MDFSVLISQKYNLSKTLMINATLRVFDDTDYMSYKELQEALNTTCKLHESKNTLASITLDDQIAYQILSEMSEKSLEDACTWTTTTLANIGSSYAVECSNSSLTNLCSQWNDVVGIKDIEKKVEILANATSDSEARSANAGSWIERQMFENESPLFDFFSKIFGCSKGRSNISC